MQGERPTIAVIVPLLNERQRLPDLIGMLRSLDADEVAIVDGGSSDGSEDLLEASSLHWCTSASGRAVQMNSGASRTCSDILLFLHADTRIDSSHLSAVRKAMGDSAIVGGRFDVRLSGSHPALRMIEWFINFRSRLTRISTGDQCQFVRREAFEEIAGFPEQPLMEDVEFSRRLKRAGNIACLRDKVTTSSRRWERHGILRTVLLMWKIRLLYWLGVSPERLARMYADVR